MKSLATHNHNQKHTHFTHPHTHNVIHSHTTLLLTLAHLFIHFIIPCDIDFGPLKSSRATLTREWREKQITSTEWGRNFLLLMEVKRDWPMTQYFKQCGGRTIPAEIHIVFHSCRPWRRTWSYIEHRLMKSRQEIDQWSGAQFCSISLNIWSVVHSELCFSAHLVLSWYSNCHSLSVSSTTYTIYYLSF